MLVVGFLLIEHVVDGVLAVDVAFDVLDAAVDDPLRHFREFEADQLRDDRG